MRAAVYTLHLPTLAPPGDPVALDRAVLVQEGFSWPAFVFTVFWFLWHRLWWAALGVFLSITALGVLLQALHVHPVPGVIAQALLSFLIALEASSLRQWTLRRNGMPMVDTVLATNLDEAETKSFARWLTRRSGTLEMTSVSPVPPAPVPSAHLPRIDAAPEIIGLFPEPQR